MSTSKDLELSSEEKVKSDALRLLAVRPRSVEELRGRLKLKRHAPAAIEAVLELLKKQGLLNDEKFAKLFTGTLIHSKRVGRRQLEMDLKKKGLSAGVIQGALSDLKDYDEKDAAKKAVENRYRRLKGLSPEKKKARLFAFLKRRGFSNDAILSVLTDLAKEDLPEELDSNES